MIYGIGIDIVNIPQFRTAIERWGDRFKKRVFTKKELEYCNGRTFTEQHLAARFAAKEAFIKALGRGIKLTNIEVLNNQEGKPYMKISDWGLGVGEKTENKKMRSLEDEKKHATSQPLSLSTSGFQELRTHLTLSHDGDYCVAQVIIEVGK